MNMDEFLADFLGEKINDTNSARTLAEQILRGAKNGLEINGIGFESWFENRFKYQFVWLDKDDYSKALVRALWLAPVFAGTDFGNSRQRDMAQVWTDTSRGFLGEIAVSRFLKEKIPQFDPIPAYIAGYLNKNELDLPIHQLICRKKGRTNIRITVTQGIGIFSRETLRKNPYIRKLDPDGVLGIEIEPIIDSITTPHFLAHSGGLKWGEENWRKLIEHL